MRASMYAMYIYIDISCLKYGIQNMYNDGEYLQNILLKTSKPNVRKKSLKLC
jgi:hypothetical protein